MHLLMIESDEFFALQTSRALQKEHIIVEVAHDGEEGLEFLSLYTYDLIILEATLMYMDGYEVLRKIRRIGITTPVIILTSIDDLNHRLEAFDTGADDVLVKPFHHKELLARLRAIIRRSNGHAVPRIQFGKIILDQSKRHVETTCGVRLRLTNKQYQILEMLALNREKLVTKSAIHFHIFSAADDEPNSNVIMTIIFRLRKMMAEATNGENYIETVQGQGYILHTKNVEYSVSPLKEGRRIR